VGGVPAGPPMWTPTPNPSPQGEGEQHVGVGAMSHIAGLEIISAVIPGRDAVANPESLVWLAHIPPRDSGFDASHRSGMTASIGAAP